MKNEASSRIIFCSITSSSELYNYHFPYSLTALTISASGAIAPLPNIPQASLDSTGSTMDNLCVKITGFSLTELPIVIGW